MGSDVPREGSQHCLQCVEGSFELLAVLIRSGMGLRWHFDGTGFSTAEYGWVSLVGSEDG